MITLKHLFPFAIACFPVSGLVLLHGQDSKSSRVELERNQEPKQKKNDSTPKKTRVIRLFNGKDLKGLKVLEKSYYEDHGKVHVKDGTLLISKGLPGSGIRIDPEIHKDLPRIDYEVFVTAKRVAGSDFFCGLTFPINKSYCTLILGGWGGGSIGLSNVDSLSAIENETTGFHDFENGRWYDIHLKVTAKKIEASLTPAVPKGKKPKTEKLFSIGSGDHKYDIWWEQEPARPFGLTTWGTTAAIKRLEIRTLGPQKKK